MSLPFAGMFASILFNEIEDDGVMRKDVSITIDGRNQSLLNFKQRRNLHLILYTTVDTHTSWSCCLKFGAIRLSNSFHTHLSYTRAPDLQSYLIGFSPLSPLHQ